MMMSDMDDTSRGPELTAERRDRPRRFSRGRMLVTLLAFIAFSSFSWYAYRQATKAGEGGVAPLIKAEEGPTRVKPEEPGGMDVPHQDKTIFARMGSEQPAQAKVESLLPEPEAPMPRPAAAPAATPATVASTTTNMNAPSAQPPAASLPAKTAAAKEKTASTQVAAVPPPPPPSAAEANAMAKIAPAAGEPARTEAAPPPPAGETKTAAVEPAPAASAAASGSYRVQLGALRSQEAADAQWTKLQKTFPDLLSALSLNVQKVDIAGKGTFYRVQAGALSESAAKELCDEMKRRKAECIVVKS